MSFLRSKCMVRLAGLALFLLAQPAVQACAVCAGKSDSRMAAGMNAGILALLGVIGGVLALVVAFFVFLAFRVSGTSASFESEPAHSGN